MDPVTTTLAVITFATAVKDLVELAQAIRDAFAKVPQNYKKAGDLALDILRTSKQIQTLYDNKKDIIELAEDLKVSLQELNQEMTLVRDECARLIPPKSQKIRDKFKIAFYSFWNREKVEQLVSGLESRIQSCYRDFSLLSNIRIEATVNEMSRIVNTGTVVRVQSYSEERSRGNFNFPQLSNTRLFEFSQSYSNPMTRIEDTMSDADLYNAVLRRELVKIKVSLGCLISSWNEVQPKEISPLETTWDLERPVVSDTVARQSLLVNAFQLQSLIEFDSTDIVKINSEISVFCFHLANLGMFEDNLAISLLAADCWKKIASLSPTNSLNAWIYLAHKLENVSNSYSLIGDKDGAYTQAREAMNIMIQKKLDCDPSPEVQTLRAQILCIHAKTTRTPQLMNSIELAASAVLTMEGVLRLHNFDKEKLPIDLHPMTSSISSHSMNKSTLEVDDTNSESDFHNSLYSYSGTLLDFSSLQWRQGYISEAHATKKRALVILHFLLLEYPDSQMLLEATASVVLGLCDSTYCDLNSLAENLAYAEEGADIYRKLLKIDFSAYILRLLDTLQLYGQIFREAAMVQDSERIFKEMTALSECASQRYQDLKFPSEIDADYQYRLAAIFYYQDRSSEGIYAAHNAIEQYSALAFLDPDRSSLKLINALIMLCKMLHDTNQHQSAVIEGFKALRLVDNTVGTDKKIQNFVDSDTYFSLIDGIMDALADSPPDPSSLGKASTLITRFKRVFFSSDKFDFKSRTPGMYVEVLDKNGLVDDAISYGQDFLSACERKYSHSNSFESMYSYLYCMEKHIKSLKKNCRIHDALKYSTNMAAIVRPRSHHHKDPSIRKPQYDLSRTHMELLCSVGLYKTALEFTQAAFIKLNSDEGPSVGEDNHYVLHELFDLALMQLHNFLPLQAIETASQAESLSRLEISNGNTENTCFVTMLYYSIYIKSNALFDMAGISQALVYAMEMKDGIQGRDDPYLQSANDRGNCLVSATLARIYFAQNDCAQAKQLMVQVLEMDRKLFEKEKSHFVQLSFDLLFAGIAFCCVDEHEAGVALLIELEDLQRKFSVTHPALAREVEFDLEMQAQRGQWKLIQTAARAKLTCDHVDQTLNLKIAHSDNSSGLEVVEERFHISMPCMYIHRL